MDEELQDLVSDTESAKKEISDDPLECAENLKNSESEDGPANDFINEIVKTVSERMKNPFGLPEFALENTFDKRLYADTPSERRRRRNRETKEAQEFRLLRQRMVQMKIRLLTSLETPEKAEEEKKRSTEAMRLKRQKIRKMETPEEAAARKRRHADQMRSSRKRLLALETPEQTAARIARRNERKKLRTQERHARETPEERAARRERERSYRDKMIEKSKMPNARLAAKTGKIRTPKVTKVEGSIETSESIV